MFTTTALMLSLVMGWPGWHNPVVVDKLNLSDAQLQQIDDIHQKYQLQRIDLQAKIQKKRLQLASLWNDDQPDMNQIEKLVNEIGDLTTQMRLLGVRERAEIYSILSDEQRTELRKLMWLHGRFRRRGGPARRRW